MNTDVDDNLAPIERCRESLLALKSPLTENERVLSQAIGHLVDELEDQLAIAEELQAQLELAGEIAARANETIQRILLATSLPFKPGSA